MDPLWRRETLMEDTDAQRKLERRATLEAGYAILHGRFAPLDEMEQAAYRAQDLRAFSLARKLLALTRRHSDAAALPPARKLKLLQQHALCFVAAWQGDISFRNREISA